MTIKPFAIQGADLTLGGVNLQAGATTIVIPGVTQAANYFVEEVDEYGSDDNQDLGSQEGAITIIDNAEYVYRSGGAQPSGAYVPAEYSVDELDDGNIEEVQVEVDGTFAAADKTRAEASNMWATLTPTPFVSFDPLNWTQIPFRPKMRAGEVTNVGGGSGGVVERSIEFPAGEEGDTAGTLALIPNGELYFCTTDWFDYNTYGGEYSGLVTTGEFLPSQTGFVSNAATILRVNVPQEVLYILQNAEIVSSDWSITMANAGFGGEYTCTNVAFNVDNNPEFSWPYRNGTDPVGIPEGSTFTVSYNGTVPQPAIWQQITLGNSSGDRLVNGLNEVVLDVNGNLTAPGDITTGTDGGRFIQDCDDGTTSMRWINVNQGSSSTQLIRVYTGDPDEDNEVERAQIKLNWDQTEDKSGLTIRTFDDSDDSTNHDWLFKGDGVLQLPVGGDIVDSTGASVLGGGAGGDANIWVETFASDAPATDQVQIATSVEYDADGNIFALFHHYVNIPPNASETYTSVAKLSPTGAVLWQVRFNANINTDGWGLAYDGADTVYVAGSTDGTPLTYQFATLTKIDAFDGTIVWNKTYDFEADSQSSVVDVDSNLNPIMVGYAYNGTDNYIITTKVDAADGSVIWSRTLDGQNDDEAYGMAVGPTGEVVTIGNIGQLGTGVTDGAATLYTDPASNVNWTTGANISGAGISCDVTFTDGVPTFTNIVDSTGGRTVDGTVATISGASFGGTSPADDMILKVGTLAVNDTDDRMVVIKYSAGGTIAWQKAVLFDEGYSCSGADADIDADGNIYVCGSYNTPIGSAMSLVKFDSSGVKQWSRRVVGDCADFATSVVVGPDNNLYLSGITAGPNAQSITWVVAKYSITGAVVWQRLIENTASWTFTGGLFFGTSGGSNIAVGTDYVALAGGFGTLENGEDPTATVVQIDTNGTPFAIGNWAVTTASFTGNLNDTASDILVVNAGKTTGTVTPAVADFVVTDDTTTFLVGTLYTAPGGNDSLVNGAYSVSLGNTGTVTLPAGGTITEGYVTSNPTIQLTPASPDVASQKLVIKGGGMFDYTDNGINLNYNDNIAQVGDTLTFFVNSTTYADQTLYWWITPAGVGIGDSESGTVVLTGSGGQFTILVDSDDYEFRIRVSPEADNYDPASLGVESGLINPDAPTFDADHHLHLTTGNLAETSIFLGTDNHNVRTTVNGGIEITTPNTTDNVWRFGTDGTTTFPTLTVERGDDPSNTITGQTLLFGDSTQEAIISTPNGTVANNSSQRLVINPGEGYNGGEGGDIYLWAGRGGDASGTGGDIKIRGGQGGANTDGGAGGDGGYIRIEAGDAASTGGDAGYVDIHGGLSTTSGGAVNIRTATTNTFNHAWQFGNNGMLTLPKASKVSEVTPATGPAPSIYPTPGESSIANEAFVTVPPPAVNNYTIPGTDIVINMTFGANGPSFYGPTATIVNGGTGHTTGESLMIPYADMGITYGGNWEWFVNAIASNLVLEAGTKDWTFAADGTTTFPGAITRVVVGTVAKTGVVLPTTTGVVDGLTSNSALAGLTDGTYGPFTLTGVTLSVVVFGGVINGFSNVSGTATVNDVLGTVDSGDVGGTAGTTITITVSTVVQATPTALDLTKSVNKLTTGYYTLADGVEGQVMHLVRQTSTNNATVIVANARVAGDQYTALEHYPFTAGDIGMLIFTDGAWQSMSGTWD